MSVRMSARTRKNRPIPIASYITVTPEWLGRIMQSLRNTFITGFCIQNRLQWSHRQSIFYIAPIVLLQSGYRSITISFFLTIASVPTLEHIHIHPLLIIQMCSTRCTAKRMKSHYMILVHSKNAVCQGFPNLGIPVGVCISTDYPNDIRSIFISFT